MNVTACRALNSKTIAKFEDEIFDILNRARFDGGELNRTRDALLPQPKTDTKSTKAETKTASKKEPNETAQAAPVNYPKLGPVASLLDGAVIKTR